jgi:uncharacterized protein (DUF2237 family)
VETQEFSVSRVFASAHDVRPAMAQVAEQERVAASRSFALAARQYALQQCTCTLAACRNGYCETGPSDFGTHTVCAKVTQQFLDYTLQQGNDLITPHPEYRCGAPAISWPAAAVPQATSLQVGIGPCAAVEAAS